MRWFKKKESGLGKLFKEDIKTKDQAIIQIGRLARDIRQASLGAFIGICLFAVLIIIW